jgi:hypothetical protein
VTLRTEGRGLIRVNAAEGVEWVRLNWKGLYPEAGEGEWWTVPVGITGSPGGMEEKVPSQGDTLGFTLTECRQWLLAGPAALAGRAELAVLGVQPVPRWPVRQGDPLAVNADLRNYGGKTATDVKVTVKDGQGPGASVMATQRVTLKPYGAQRVDLKLDTSRRDGALPVVVTVDSDARFVEISEGDNRRSTLVTITPDWSRWDSYLDLTVAAEAPGVGSPLVTLPFDAPAERTKLGLGGTLDPASLRVSVEGHLPVPAQTISGASDPELVFLWSGSLPGAVPQPCRLYMDGGSRHEPLAPGRWDAARTRYVGPLYQVTFEQGAITTVAMGDLPLLSSLQTSSGDTGWVIEQGEAQELNVVADGPVCTIIEVKKNLLKGHSYHKRYELFYDFFTVTTLSPERYGTMSRAYYVATGQIEDDKGNKATIDGQGDAEGFSGMNPSPRWYATWDRDGNWTLNAIAVTPHDGVTYWDAGNMAGVGFNTGDPAPATVAYFLHRGPGARFDPRARAESDYQRAHTKVTVTR